MRSFGSELKFAADHASDGRNFRRLFWRTLQFHLHNHSRARRTPFPRDFEVTLNLPGGPATLTLRTVVGDIFVLYEILAGEVYCLPPEMADPSQVRVIVDACANIGITSIYLADRYPQATIFSIEPHPDNFRILCANARNRPRIKPIQGCLCGENPGPRFLSTDRPAWGNKLVAKGEGLEVRGLTVESVLQDFGLEHIDILKIDIEGGEKEVFAQPRFLSRVGLVMAELHFGYTPEHLRNDVRPMGFLVHLPQPGCGFKMVIAQPAVSAPA
jgi:FkbM family methyltransferase